MKFTINQIHIIKQALEFYEEELPNAYNHSNWTELEVEKAYDNVNSIREILNHAELHNDS